MALSYSGIIGHGKYTMPSVDSWYTDNNIIRDPVRSIVAPRRDKVGSTSAITEEIEMSRDRIAEAIRAYPRGVNSMVGVSYNGGGNAGIGTGQALFHAGQQAKLSYRVMMDGAFRPPVLAPVDLLPLSRMPRLVTKVNCAVNRPDFQKKLTCEAQKNTYRPMILNTYCDTKKQWNIRKPCEVQDRRHINTRKGPVAHNVGSGVAQCGNDRSSNCPITIKPVLQTQITAARSQRREMAGRGAEVNCMSKHIGRTLVGEITGVSAAPKCASTAPVSLAGCRDEVLRAEILPRDVIGHVFDTERPAYKRAFGFGAVLAPDGGVYRR